MQAKTVKLEVQLLGWKKSQSNQSPTIKLGLLSDDDMEFFELLTVGKGKIAGQILNVEFTLSPDDPQHGTAASMETPKKKKESPPLCAEAIAWMKKENTKLRPSVFAALMCKKKTYEDYVRKVEFDGDPVTYMKIYCEVDSRSEFDYDPKALERFENHLSEYRKYING